MQTLAADWPPFLHRAHPLRDPGSSNRQSPERRCNQHMPKLTFNRKKLNPCTHVVETPHAALTNLKADENLHACKVSQSQPANAMRSSVVDEATASPAFHVHRLAPGLNQTCLRQADCCANYSSKPPWQSTRLSAAQGNAHPVRTSQQPSPHCFNVILLSRFRP